MAIDEAILRGYIAGIVPPTLRIYGWRPRGISLGYFQKVNEVLNIEKCKEFDVNFVRRTTGGEAIFHGDDVTYSIICSKKDLQLPESVKESFKGICSFLINAYRILNLPARYFCEEKSFLLRKKYSEFCFATNQSFDIAISGKKIGGNAQRRKKEVIFQHGSIPIRFKVGEIKQFFCEELTAIEDNVLSLENALGRNVTFEDFSSILIDSFRQTFSVKLIEGSLSSFEMELSQQLREQKYSIYEWNYSRFDISDVNLHSYEY